MILLIDNYDSFTYNLVQQFKDVPLIVLRNDDPQLLNVAQEAAAIVLSPGPGKPQDAGQLEEVIAKFYQTKPILGICLGHQAIAEVFGGTVTGASEIMHGKQSSITFEEKDLFAKVKSPMTVMRYHSLKVLDLPPVLEVTAQTADGTVMALKHRDYPLYGLQFHPESIGTPQGQLLIDAFMAKVGEKR